MFIYNCLKLKEKVALGWDGMHCYKVWTSFVRELVKKLNLRDIGKQELISLCSVKEGR
jgi:hypothetical protein